MTDIPYYNDRGISTAELRKLEALLEMNESIHWIKINPDSGLYELTLDNQMLSTFRSCKAHFIEAYIHGLALKGGARNWNLDFGILFHKMIEAYYKEFRTPSFIMQDWAIKRGVEEWKAAGMDFHVAHKEYQAMGGAMGFCGLLIAYATYFSAENERLRVIGTEISFGKNKEVFLGRVPLGLDMYLSGRIDVLADDVSSIFPLDHKTMGSMRFDPAQRFGMDEGPTGYIFAVNQILPEFLKVSGLEGKVNRTCNKIMMNFVVKNMPQSKLGNGEQFKRLPILKTSEQLESYRQRMLLTGEDIFRTLISYASTGQVLRDTSKCTNWYMSDCLYLSIHRQNSASNEALVKEQFYEIKPIWNTETVND